MRHRTITLLAAALVGWSTQSFAQVPDWVSQVIAAAQLPVATSSARLEGVTSDEIRSVLDAMRNAGVPAYEAAALIDTTRDVRREHGPVGNFGAFVQSQLAAGKRGPELAAAIREEHAREGKGHAKKGKMKEKSDERSDDKADDKPNRGRGRPLSALRR